MAHYHKNKSRESVTPLFLVHFFFHSSFLLLTHRNPAMALIALLVGVLAVASAASAAVAPRTWESWSAKTAAAAFAEPARRLRDVACPVPITGFTDLALLIGMPATESVSPVANCIAQDGTALRPGKLVTSSQDEAEVTRSERKDDKRRGERTKEKRKVCE
jgi:hypothetical protein